MTYKRMSSASPGSFSVPWSDSDVPSLNAPRFKEMVVVKVRENPLTDSSTREPVRLVGEEMDGIAREQRRRLETTKAELVGVKRRLEQLYDLAAIADLDIRPPKAKPLLQAAHRQQAKIRPSKTPTTGSWLSPLARTTTVSARAMPPTA